MCDCTSDLIVRIRIGSMGGEVRNTCFVVIVSRYLLQLRHDGHVSPKGKVTKCTAHQVQLLRRPRTPALKELYLDTPCHQPVALSNTAHHSTALARYQPSAKAKKFTCRGNNTPTGKKNYRHAKTVH